MARKLIVILTLCLLLAAGCGSPGKQTIRSCVRSIMESPADSAVIGDAVAGIWQILLKEFPEEEYTRSYTFEELREGLLNAIHSGQPFVIAFAPDTVFSAGSQWDWTTSFRELAGHGVTLEYMSPRISAPNGDVYTFASGDDKMTQSVALWAFGKGSYPWWCSGEFAGSSVALNFGRDGATSYTTIYSTAQPDTPSGEQPPPPPMNN